MILDVPGGKIARELAFELGEQIGRHFPQRIDQHVEPPPVRHADDHFRHAGGARFLDQMVEHRDHRVAALAGKALLADVFGAEIALERLGRRQALENVLAERRRVNWPRAQRLDALLDEPLLRRVGHVHVLGAEGAAVRLL